MIISQRGKKNYIPEETFCSCLKETFHHNFNIVKQLRHTHTEESKLGEGEKNFQVAVKCEQLSENCMNQLKYSTINFLCYFPLK